MRHLIHVGMPKAASTWLQDVFFREHPQLAVLGSSFGHDDEDLHRRYVPEMRRVVLGNELTCDLDAFARTLGELVEENARRRRVEGKDVRVAGVSHELWAGALGSGHGCALAARGLARAFQDAKVILIVREQRAMLESMYRQAVRQGSVATLHETVADPAACGGFEHDDRPLASQVVANHAYAPRVRLYRRLFGADNVHVDCMERLREEPDAFARDICRFLDVDEFVPRPRRVNHQLSPAALRVLRVLNHAFDTPYHPRLGRRPLTSLVAWLAARASASQRRLRRDNPLLQRARASAWLQRRLAFGVLPALDRFGLQHVPASRAFSFDALPLRVQREALARYAEDNGALQSLLREAEGGGPDLAALGYVMPPVAVDTPRDRSKTSPQTATREDAVNRSEPAPAAVEDEA